MIFTLSSLSEMTPYIMGFQLSEISQKYGIISIELMTERFSRYIISRDEGLLFKVSSPESLVKDDYVYYEVSSLLE